MADSINIPPSTQLQAPNQVAQGGNSPTPATLGSQTPGTILQGFVINRDASGTPIIRTENGDIPVVTNYFLKIGSEVVIRIGNTAGTPVAHLISVDGQTPAEAQAQSAFSQEPEVILSPQLSQSLATESSSATALPQAVQEPGTTITLTGTVIAPPQTVQASSPLVQQQPVNTGTQLTVRVLSIGTAPPATASELPQTAVVTPGSALPQVNSAFYATYARAAGNTPPSQPTGAVVNVPAAQTPITTAPVAPSQAVLAQAEPALQPPTVQAPVTTTTTAPAATPTTAPAATATQTAEPTPTAVTTAQALPVTADNAPAAPAIAAVTAAPAFPSVPNPPVAPGTVISATVIGHDNTTGETLIQSPLGVVRLQTPAPLPNGSQISLQVLQSTPPAPQNIPAFAASQQPAPVTQLAQQWSSLQQIFSLLAGRATVAGLEETPAASVPVPTLSAQATQVPAGTVTAQSITTGLFNFMAALRSGNFEHWLGNDAFHSLQQQGADDLIRKSQAEFSTLVRQYTQAQPNHWQPLFFPVVADGNPQQVRIYVKRDRKQGNSQGKAGKDEDTRFVVEVDLSQLGELQMDGFVRRQDKSLQFDMVIRSTSGLSDDVQNDILRIYNDMGSITGYTGSISFQTVRDFPVNPMEEIVATHNAVTA